MLTHNDKVSYINYSIAIHIRIGIQGCCYLFPKMLAYQNKVKYIHLSISIDIPGRKFCHCYSAL